MELQSTKQPSPSLDVIHAIRNYIDKAVAMVPGMKILLLDDETAVVVGLVYSHTEMLQREVYLFENIIQRDNNGNEIERQQMPHLNAFCLLRPTLSNVRLLEKEIQNPKYGKYYLFFTNVLNERAIEILARADEKQVIKEVNEFFSDYFPVNDNVFTLNCPLESGLQSEAWTKNYLPRIKEGIFACLLSLKMRPTIRAQKSSPLAMILAEEIAATLQDNEIKKNYFKFKPKSESMLFILDRCEDPITPLLTQWTYQAMAHELLTIRNNLVDVPKRSKDSRKEPEFETQVLSPQQDVFYKDNMYANYGDLGVTIKKLVENYQSKSTRKEDIKTIDDIRHFVSTYSDFKKFGGTVDKHVSIMLELQRQISSRYLMDLSELEQSLACKESHDEATKRLESILSDQQRQYDPYDLLRLLMIYALRYENHKTEIDRLKYLLRDRMVRKNLTIENVELVSELLAYAGTKKRTKEADLFKKQNVVVNFFKKVTDLRDVPNVFAQHKPLIVELVEQIQKGKLSLDSYPLILGESLRPREIFIFIVGGITCEEAYFIHKNNVDPNSGITLLLGGTQLHNSQSFISLLRRRKEDLELNEVPIDLT